MVLLLYFQNPLPCRRENVAKKVIFALTTQPTIFKDGQSTSFVSQFIFLFPATVFLFTCQIWLKQSFITLFRRLDSKFITYNYKSVASKLKLFSVLKLHGLVQKYNFNTRNRVSYVKEMESAKVFDFPLLPRDVKEPVFVLQLVFALWE